jgi:hypothetical protein
MAAHGRQRAETLRKPGVAADVPKTTYNAQPMLQVHPRQSLLCFEQLTPDSLLDPVSVGFPLQ